MGPLRGTPGTTVRARGSEARGGPKERLEFRCAGGGIYTLRRALQLRANVEVPRATGQSDPDLKIISKYVLREHAGPLTFALTALTSLMLLNFISRQFGELVGKGLSWGVIGEFFLLSIPFTVALTVPMSVLVAVLYAFSRLAAENEVTALKASGVSPWRMVAPAIGGGLVWSIGLLAFNDQVLPRANHRLKVLQDDISQTKPTFLLKEQVINTIAEGKLYLKAGKIDHSGESGRMKEVVIYDLSDPMRRKTIYADAGRIMMDANRTDINLDLYRGQMQEVSTETPGQLDRLFFKHDRIRIRDVTRDFKKTESDSASKGDREMGICEMQNRLRIAEGAYRLARRDYDAVANAPEQLPYAPSMNREAAMAAPDPGGIGWVYCSVLRSLLRVKEAHAEGLPPRAAAADTVPVRDTAARDTAARDSATRAPTADSSARARRQLRAEVARRDSLHKAMMAGIASPRSGAPMSAGTQSPVRGAAPAPVPVVPPVGGAADRPTTVTPSTAKLMPTTDIGDVRTMEARVRLDMATKTRNRYEIEIHKKFSLAAACLIFAVLGAPLAVRFPRGGVGLVLGVSLLVFALYYVGLIGGEALANEGKVPPFWAMWGTNVLLTLVGVVLLFRMGKDQNTGRGGGWSDRVDRIKLWFGRGPRPGRTAGGA
ncbi:MAG: permease YjgP/YjgQ family protein [Gemmatimonadetes bacterium]|nr:permease YjgP/YjgQ family protein [Gemmatimonadota bacterium]